MTREEKMISWSLAQLEEKQDGMKEKLTRTRELEAQSEKKAEVRRSWNRFTE